MGVNSSRLTVNSSMVAAALVFLYCAPALADRDKPVLQSSWARVELRAELQSLFHFRSDADFDRRQREYDESGQTVGAFATLFTPSVTMHIMDRLRIYYELELGLNFWSKHNPDQQDALSADVFVLKHREIYGAGELWDEQLGFRVGYAHFWEPTGLFINHWFGLAEVHLTLSEQVRVGLFAGQLPDQTYEGIALTDNNFTHDIWVFGARSEVQWSERIKLNAAVTGLYDASVVDRTRWVMVPSARLELTWERLRVSLDAALQAGQVLGMARDGGDETHLAWAAQANAQLRLGRLELAFNALALSPDDAHQGNGNSHGFLYSGKSRSATLMLTEDETRDWYDNLDERMSGARGGLFHNRAGLFISDLKATWNLHEIYRPSLVVGAATVLKPQNALDGVLVAVEADIVLEFHFSDFLVGHLVGGMLIPGDAGGALINRQGGLTATDAIVMTEASLLLRY